MLVAASPGAPTGVAAVSGSGQAVVSFIAASDGGATISGYTVTSSPDGLTATGASSPITITGLTNGTSYTFTVTATNSVGTGSASSASSAVTPATTPGAPTSVSAVAANTQATVSFTAPASDGGAAITGYTVTSSPAGGTDSNAGSTSLSHVITGLTNGTSYTFTVTATNSAGTSSASSASSAVTPATSPGAPTSVAAVRGPGEAVVSFSAPVSNGGAAITSYTVTASPGGVTATGASSPITITGLTNGTSYTFTVTATNSVATGSASSASSAITPAAASTAGVSYGSTGGTVELRSTAVDAAGNIYLAGNFSVQTTLELGGVTLNRMGTQDAWVAKLNSNGTVVWAKNYGGSGASAQSRGVAVDGSGNVYLGGYFERANLTTPALTKLGTLDAFALKLDSSGAVVWAKNYGGSGATAAGFGIAVDGSSNVYLGGYFEGANLTTPALTKLGTSDAFALKLDSSGATTWAKHYGGSGASAAGTGIAVDGSGNVYLGGYFITANLTTPALTKLGASDAFALKLDSSGATTWAKNYGGSGARANGRGIAVDGSGNVYLGGYFQSANLTTPALTRIGPADAFALKLDSSGTTTWAQNYGGSGAAATVRGIAVDGSSNVYLGGHFETANLTTPALTRIGTSDAFALSSTSDAFALKLNSSGTTTWAKNYGGSGATAYGYGIAVDGSGYVYLGGYFSRASLTTPALTIPSSSSTRTFLIAPFVPDTVPGAPTAVSAVATNAQATVSFTVPASDGGAAITGYTVTSSPAGGTDSNAGSTSFSHMITGLTNGTSYTFTVTATNSIGTGSASSASSSVTPSTTPTVTSPTSASVGNTSATLGGNVTATGGASLTAVGVVYAVTSANNNPQLSGTGVTNLAGTAATGVFTVSATGLTAGTAYSYAAYATNSVGTTYSSVGTFTTTVPTPTLTFTTPSTASVAVGATQTNAVTSTLSGGSYGAISYASNSPSVATVDATTGLVTGLAVGTTTITATQAAAAGFNATTSTSYTLTVTIGTPTISAAPTASGITYGQTLAASTLSGGTASTAGAFTFTTTSTAPGAGTAAQGVTFTPTDTTNYTSTTTTANVSVAKATPTISVAPTASGITYGQTLASSTLSGGTASTAGTFTFTTTSTAPNAGTAAQGVTFTPSSTANYNPATTTVNVTVAKATPIVTWATPTAITYGTALSSTQLNATASVAGSFIYTPAGGTVLTAGSQSLSVGFTPSDAANYHAVPTTTVNLTVDRASQTITFGTLANKTYGAASFAVAATASSSLTPSYSIVSGPATLSASTVTITGAGTVVVRASQAGDANYTAATPVDQSFTVAKATLTVTADAKSRAYGAANPPFTATITGYVNSETSAVLSGAAAVTTTATSTSTVGDYAIIAAAGTLSATNYDFSFTAGTLTVSKAPLTVTAEAKSRIYGDANPTLTATITGYVNSETSTVVSGTAAVTTTATASSNVGSYAITPALGSLSATNYSFSFANGTLTVDKAALSVTADNQSKLYGAANPALTTTITGFKNSETIAVLAGTPALSTVATPSSGVASYAITAAIGTLASANYSFGFFDGTLAVTKASLTVTADSKTRAYGVAEPTFTATLTGFVNSETLATSGVSGTAAVTTTATLTSAVGTYPLSPVVGTLTASNYAFTTFTNSTLTIGQASQTITFGTLANKTYGAASFAVAATASSSLTPSYSIVSGPATLSGSMVTITGAGTVTVRTSQAGDANYTAATSVDQSFTVAKATLTVTADAKSRLYGAANPAFTATITGYVNSETSAVVSGTATLSTTATPTSTVGDYAITAAAGSLSATNFDFSFTAGTLTLSKAPLTVAANPAARVFGAANPTFTATLTGFVNSETLGTSGVTGGAAFTTAAGATSIVGAYAITPGVGTLASANYAFTTFTDGVLTIGQANAAVALGNLAQTYNGSPRPVSVTTEPTGLSVALTYDGNAVAPVNAGSYAVLARVNDGGNYFGTVVGALTVAKAAQTIALTAPAATTFGKPVTLAATASSGLPVTFAVTGPAALSGSTLTFSAAGTATVTATQAGDGNTSPATATVTVTAGKVEQTIAFTAPATTTFGKPVTLAATASSGLPVTFAVTGPATISGATLTFSAAGTATVTAMQAGDGNTLLATATVTVTAAKATQTIAFTAPTATTWGKPVTLAATASSGLPVTFAVTGPATISGSILTLSAAGTVTVTATQAGDDNTLPATATVTVTAAKAEQTIALTAPATTTFGKPVTLAATTSSGLPVTFEVTGPAALSGSTLTFSAAGTATVTATQAGDGNTLPATATVTVIAAKAAQTIAFTTPATAAVGAPVTLVAIASSGLPVTLAVAGPAALNGATLTLSAAGTATVTATQAGDERYHPAAAAVTVTTAEKLPQTIAFTAPATATVGTPVTLGATASSGLPVTLAFTGPAALSGSTLTASAAGTVTVTATQAGDGTYLPATATVTLTTVEKLRQTIAFAPLGDRVSNAGSFALNASASSGLPVTFTIVSGPALLAGTTVNLSGPAGLVVIRASQVGNLIYGAAPEVTRTFTVSAPVQAVYFGNVSTAGSSAKSGDVAAVIPPGANQGALLFVAPGVGVNTVLDFTLNPDGTFNQTITIAAAPVLAQGASTERLPAVAAAPMTLTVRGSLVNGRLQGVIEPIGLAFNALVQSTAGPSASAAGFYSSNTLATTSGGTYSVVGTNNQVLVLATTPELSTGGLTSLAANGTFSVQTQTANGPATIRGAVDESATSVSGSLTLPGQAETTFAGLKTTTTRTDRLINLSSRLRIGAGGNVLIAGFVIGGTEAKEVLIRGIGPALAGLGVQGTLANPQLRLYRGSEVIAQNDDWSTGADSAASAAAFLRLGAFALAPGSKDAALLVTLVPGAYTAHVVADAAGGVALAEIYDASGNPNADYQRLINLSTRGDVGTGENILIGGFIVTGNAPKKVLVRAIGPSLTAFGVAGALADPRLRVFNGAALIAENDNWSIVPADTAATAQAARDTGAFALANGSKDAALILTLAPGAYTAQVSGADGASTGVALIEVYEVP